MKIEQKEFLVTKVEKYKADIKDSNKSITIAAVGLGVTAALAFISAEGVLGEGSLMQTIIPVIQLGFSANNIRALISEIGKKTGLQNRVDTINDQIEFDSLENNSKDRSI